VLLPALDDAAQELVTLNSKAAGAGERLVRRRHDMPSNPL